MILVSHLSFIVALKVQIRQGSIWSVLKFQWVGCRMENGLWEPEISAPGRDVIDIDQQHCQPPTDILFILCYFQQISEFLLLWIFIEISLYNLFSVWVLCFYLASKHLHVCHANKQWHAKDPYVTNWLLEASLCENCLPAILFSQVSLLFSSNALLHIHPLSYIHTC